LPFTLKNVKAKSITITCPAGHKILLKGNMEEKEKIE
jgi:hypothetical protein